jgi:hypothetical protein
MLRAASTSNIRTPLLTVSHANRFALNLPLIGGTER